MTMKISSTVVPNSRLKPSFTASSICPTTSRLKRCAGKTPAGRSLIPWPVSGAQSTSTHQNGMVLQIGGWPGTRACCQRPVSGSYSGRLPCVRPRGQSPQLPACNLQRSRLVTQSFFHSCFLVQFAPPECRGQSGSGLVCNSLVDTLPRVLYTRYCDRQLSTRRAAGALRDRQESEGAAGPVQTLQKGDGRAPCCDGGFRPEHAGLECAPIEGQSRGPARDGCQWPLAHHVPVGRQGRPRAGTRAVSLNGRHDDGDD
jgi:hypothetical protein